MGETCATGPSSRCCWGAFSILERIDVGETEMLGGAWARVVLLSVSSNGSTWVKLIADDGSTDATPEVFQYPRTDRRG